MVFLMEVAIIEEMYVKLLAGHLKLHQVWLWLFLVPIIERWSFHICETQSQQQVLSTYQHGEYESHKHDITLVVYLSKVHLWWIVRSDLRANHSILL